MKEIYEMNDEEIRSLMSKMKEELETRDKKREERRLKREVQRKLREAELRNNEKKNNVGISVGKYYTNGDGEYYRVESIDNKNTKDNIVKFDKLVYKVGKYFTKSSATSSCTLSIEEFKDKVSHEISKDKFTEVMNKIYKSFEHPSIYNLSTFDDSCIFSLPTFDNWFRHALWF